MPTYEYRCTECGNQIEAFQRMSDAPLTTCPNCQKEALKRLVSGGAGVLYKGEGWYVTDYSKKSTGGKDAPSTSTSPSSSSTSTTSGSSNTPSTTSTSSSTDSSSSSLGKTGS
jgi:putative FmdB family regulatory protein